MREINSVTHRQTRELRDYSIPIDVSLHSQTFAPALGQTQTVSPISQFERRIPSLSRRMIFLCGDQRRPEHVSLPLFFEVSVRRHELGGFENDFTIAFERRAIAMRQVAKFGVKDRMRLLPNQQRADRRRTVVTFWPNHLWPARSSIALRRGEFARGGKNRSVPTKTSLQQRQAIPQGEVRRVPPMHLQMGFAVPTVDRQSRFLRWHRACALNGGGGLAERHPPVEVPHAESAA